MKIDEKLSASGGFVPDSQPGALSLDLAGGSAARPSYRLALHALAMDDDDNDDDDDPMVQCLALLKT